jgi:hypothetical protein
MKKNSLKFLAAIYLIALLLIALALPAQAQVTPTRLVGLTNMPSTVAAAGLTTTTNYVTIKQGEGIAISTRFTCSSGTTPAVLPVYGTVDGTNYSSSPIFTLGMLVNSTTLTTWTTNISAATLTGYRALNFGQITNANAGTLTNRGMIVGVPW